MPPGVSRMNVKKRKVSEESEESPPPEQPKSLLVAGRQRRSAAMKSHKVWDTLKPGAKPTLGVDDEQLSEITERTETPAKRSRKSQKAEQEGETQMEIKPQNDMSGQKSTDELKQEKESPRGRIKVASPLKAFHSQQKPAMNSEQLELIEREMEKHHQFDESHEGSDDDEEQDESSRFILDDPNDQDFVDYPTRGRSGIARGEGSTRGGRGRGGRGGAMGTASVRGMGTRGRPRGSRAMVGSGVMRGRLNVRAPMPMNYYPASQSRQSNGIYSLQPAGGIVGELARQGPPGVRILRPAGMPFQSSNFQSLRPSSMSINLSQQQVAETNFAVNRELENYRNRVVPNSSVRQFNEAIDHLLEEYQRVVDDRSRLIDSHREYVNHLKLTHQAAQDIKDNKIRHLEQTIELFQQKTMTNFKQEQLRIVKQASIPANGAEVEVDSNEPSDRRQFEEETKREVQTDVQIESAAGNSSWASSQSQQQRSIRIVGMAGRGEQNLPRLHPMVSNPPFFDDEMDDEEGLEEFDGDEDSAEMDDELGAQVTI